VQQAGGRQAETSNQHHVFSNEEQGVFQNLAINAKILVYKDA
jgi:hypothetical protein